MPVGHLNHLVSDNAHQIMSKDREEQVVIMVEVRRICSMLTSRGLVAWEKPAMPAI